MATLQVRSCGLPSAAPGRCPSPPLRSRGPLSWVNRPLHVRSHEMLEILRESPAIVACADGRPEALQAENIDKCAYLRPPRARMPEPHLRPCSEWSYFAGDEPTELPSSPTDDKAYGDAAKVACIKLELESEESGFPTSTKPSERPTPMEAAFIALALLSPDNKIDHASWTSRSLSRRPRSWS